MYAWPWDYNTDRARPGTYKNPLESEHPPYTINLFGLRGPEFDIPKPKDIYRIVVYGGSSTFSSESTDDKTTPAWLQKILRERTNKTNIEVINYGAHSKSMYWIAQQYMREVETIEPDLTIINNIRNTFGDQMQKYTPYSDIVTPQKAYLIKLNIFLTDYSLTFRYIRRLIEKVQYLVTLKSLRKEGEACCFVPKGVSKYTNPRFFNKLYPDMLEGIYADASQRGIAMMIIIEPIRCLPGNDGGFTCQWGNVKNNIPQYYGEFRKSIARVQSKHNDRLVLDPIETLHKLAAEYPDDRYIFWDPIHLNSEGNHALANLIADELLKSENCRLLEIQKACD